MISKEFNPNRLRSKHINFPLRNELNVWALELIILKSSLLAFMDSNAYWCETNQLTRHFELYSQKPQQSIRQRSPFANHKESNAQKS